MRKLTLKRVADHYEHGMFGVLMEDNIPICATLEPPWADNRPDQSCIPVGIYKCLRYASGRFGDTFLVKSAEECSRFGILFHWGNFSSDTTGCILVGKTFDTMVGKPGITHSRKAFKEFMTHLHLQAEFQLHIR